MSKHKKIYAEEYRPRKAILERRRRQKLRLIIIESYGGKCIFCGFADWRALQFDHINGGGRQHKIKFNGSTTTYLKYIQKNTDEFQLLCANCNSIKRYENEEVPRLHSDDKILSGLKNI